MSTEYIERGALMIEIEKHIETIGASAERLVARFPAADVEPVVRAKWEREFKEVPVKDGSRCVMKALYKCAGEYGCKEYSIINSKRCPNCGAHMGERSDA